MYCWLIVVSEAGHSVIMSYIISKQILSMAKCTKLFWKVCGSMITVLWLIVWRKQWQKVSLLSSRCEIVRVLKLESVVQHIHSTHTHCDSSQNKEKISRECHTFLKFVSFAWYLLFILWGSEVGWVCVKCIFCLEHTIEFQKSSHFNFAQNISFLSEKIHMSGNWVRIMQDLQKLNTCVNLFAKTRVLNRHAS